MTPKTIRNAAARCGTASGGLRAGMTFPVQNAALQQALVERGYTAPTEVQRAVLQQDAADRDLLVSAQTGSGKTVAYGLAFAATILGQDERFGPAGPPKALVIAPTRELAIQVHGELTWLYGKTAAVVVGCVGGMDPRREGRALAAGCHIVVGTPGRMQDHIKRGALNLSACDVVVLDEADEMLDLGFKDELDFILSAAPQPRRTLLFSATIAKEIAALARQYQQDALRIDTVAKNAPHADIEYRAIRVAGHEIESGLVNLLRFYESRSLVFCATREAVRRLHGRLQERGFAAVALSGELSQSERNTALQSLRDGRAQVCIATDVAARGLDLPDLDLVIHADLPTNKATLLHRSGRTGRAGRKGVCLVMVPPSKRRRAEILLASANLAVTWGEPPSAEDIFKRDQEALFADPLLTEPPLEEDAALADDLLARFNPKTVAGALIRLHRAKRPAPEDISPPPVERDIAPRPARESKPLVAGQTSGAMTWFRAGVGRKNNADPKWLIPLICRAGGITKAEIGAIRIFDRETKFEILQSAADSFAANAVAAQGQDLVISPTTPPGPGPARDPGPRPQKQKPPRAPEARAKEQARRKKNKAIKGI
jgi:ATP-dependent RNA helicase DeaD